MTTQKEEYKYPGLKASESVASKVKIKISCNLPKLDKLSNTDAKVFIFVEKKDFNQGGSSLWSLIDSTELIKDENNPVFSKPFFIDYYFETVNIYLFIFIYLFYYFIFKSRCCYCCHICYKYINDNNNNNTNNNNNNNNSNINIINSVDINIVNKHLKNNIIYEINFTY